MLYSAQLDAELIQLINQKNQSSFVNGDLVFEFLTRQPTGEMTVKVTAKPGVHYYGEKEITYVRRSLTNALKGVPVKLVVSKSATMSALVTAFSQKYGFEFDSAIDFLQSELDKEVDFSQSGLVTVTLPTADTSNIWIGELSLTVSNDALNLEELIAIVDLVRLSYLQSDTTKGSLALASWSVEHDAAGLPTVAGVTTLSRAVVVGLLAATVTDGDLKQEDADAILAKVHFTPEDTSPTTIAVDDSVTPSGFMGELVDVDQSGKFSTPNFEGAAIFRYPNVVEPIQYILNVQGGRNVDLDLTGWTDITVDWGDGASDTAGPKFTHVFAGDASNKYQIVARGTVSNPYATQSIKGFEVLEIVSWNNGMFASPTTNNCQKLTKVPNTLPTQWTSVTNLFAYASTFNGPEVLNWDTSNIINMSYMFIGSQKFNQPIGSWDVSKVTSVVNMFAQCGIFDQDLSGWDVSKVTDFSYFLSNSGSFNQSLNDWDVSNARNMSSMFSYSGYNQPLDQWDVSKVTRMVNMFSYSKVFNQDIGMWKTASLTQLDYFMRNNTAFDQDLSGWDVSKITSGLNTQGEGATKWPAEHKPGYVAPVIPTRYEVITTGGDVTIELPDTTDTKVVWGDGTSSTLDLVNNPDVYELSHTYAVDGQYTIVVTGTPTDPNVWDNVHGSQITEIVSWDNGRTFPPMISNAHSLVTVPASIPSTWTDLPSFYDATIFNDPNVLTWDTKNITSMEGAFQACPLFNQPIGIWDTSKVTTFRMMFSGASAFNQDLSDWDTSSATNMKTMFSSSGFNQDISGWDTSKVTDMSYMFTDDVIFNQNLLGWNVAAVLTKTDFDKGATAWLPENKPWYVAVSKFLKATLQPGELKLSATKPTDYSSAPWYKLASNGVKVNMTDGMIKTITIATATTIEFGWAEGVTDVRVSIGGAALLSVDQFDTIGNVTQYDFQRSPNLTKVPDQIPASVLRIDAMFSFCTSFNGPEVAGWDTKNITSMGTVFNGATVFNQDISGWNTEKLTNMTWMFQNAATFNQNLTSWNVALVTSHNGFDTGATAWDAGNKPTFTA